MRRAVIILIGWAAACVAQESHVATNAPKDKPLYGEAALFDRNIKPYVEMARKSYPRAKARFKKGLPEKHSFFVTARVYDKVGKFIDVLQERRIPLILQMVITKDGTVQSAKFQSALNHSKQDVSFCIPNTVKTQAEQIIKTIEHEPTETCITNYTYLIYDAHEKKIEEPEKVQPEDSGDKE